MATRIFIFLLSTAVLTLGLDLTLLPFLGDFELYATAANMGFALFGASILCLPWVMTPAADRREPQS